MSWTLGAGNPELMVSFALSTVTPRPNSLYQIHHTEFGTGTHVEVRYRLLPDVGLFGKLGIGRNIQYLAKWRGEEVVCNCRKSVPEAG